MLPLLPTTAKQPFFVMAFGSVGSVDFFPPHAHTDTASARQIAIRIVGLNRKPHSIIATLVIL